MALRAAVRRQHGLARADDRNTRLVALSRAHFGRIYGLISIGAGIGGFLGAWMGGLLRDWTGGYAAVMVFSVAALALAAASLGSEAGARERLSAGG